MIGGSEGPQIRGQPRTFADSGVEGEARPMVLIQGRYARRGIGCTSLVGLARQFRSTRLEAGALNDH